MNYYSITVPTAHSHEYRLYLMQNYITDYTVIPASSTTAEYRFLRYDQFLQFIRRWNHSV